MESQNPNHDLNSGDADESYDAHNISASTSPTHSPPETVSSEEELPRSPSLETILSTHGSTAVESNDSFVVPPPPHNTPATQSVASSSDNFDFDAALAALSPMLPALVVGTPEATPSEGKAHLRGKIREDMPLLAQLFKQPPKASKKVFKKRMTKKSGSSSSSSSRSTAVAPEEAIESKTEHFHEHTTWVNLAMEDISRGLERLARAAKDLHKIDESVPVSQYYGEHLAEVLKGAEIKFDAKYLE